MRLAGRYDGSGGDARHRFVHCENAPKEMLFDKWSYLTAAIRLIVAPLLVFGVFRLLTHDAFILAIMVMLAAMPVASNGTMLCLAYRGDTRAVARGTFLTTIFSMVTLPLIALLVV